MSQEMISVLRELLEHVEDDCPVEYRTKHLTAAMGEAATMLEEAVEEVVTQLSGCPVCKGDMDNVDYSKLQSDTDMCWQDALCECGAMWTEHYKYAGFDIDGEG